MHPGKCRRARPAVEIFVAAANREIRVGNINRHGPSGVRQIPDDQHARVMRAFGQCLHVVHEPGAIVDVRQHQDGGAIVEMRGKLGLIDKRQLKALFARERVGDVEVGREVGAFGEDAVRLRSLRRDPSLGCFGGSELSLSRRLAP